MAVHYTLTAYCEDCGFDLAESDDADLDVLAIAIESRADSIYREHLKTSNCV